jgi:hypothetical protein
VGEIRSYYLIGTEFLFGMMKKVLEIVVMVTHIVNMLN